MKSSEAEEDRLSEKTLENDLGVLGDLWSNLVPTPDDLEPVNQRASDRYADPPGPRRTRITNRLRDEVVARYEPGETSRQVSAACGIAKTTVLAILKAADVVIKPRSRRY